MGKQRNVRKVTHQYRERVKRVRRQLERDPSKAVCWICGDPIDMNLPTSHQMAFTLDHIIALAPGGAFLADIAPATRVVVGAHPAGRGAPATGGPPRRPAAACPGLPSGPRGHDSSRPRLSCRMGECLSMTALTNISCVVCSGCTHELFSG